MPTIGATLPSENTVANSAPSMTGGIYLHDTYKPLPNLTLNMSVRFDREATDSFGYTQFDPKAERALFDRLNQFSGGEVNQDDHSIGNNDGIQEKGYCSDPLLTYLGGTACTGNPQAPAFLNQLNADISKAKLSRLTQHHIATAGIANNLTSLVPDAVNPEGSANPYVLRQHGATFQGPNPS